MMSWYRSGRCRASCLCLLPTIFEITLVLLPVLFSSKPSLQLLVLLVVVDLGQELGFRTFVQVETCYLVEEFSRREYVRNTPPVKKLKPRIRILNICSQFIQTTSKEFIECRLDNFSMGFILINLNLSNCKNK